MATPLIASVFNRIVNERIEAGKADGRIGFVNPTLYQHPEFFNDVTVGGQSKGGLFSAGGDLGPSACENKGKTNCNARFRALLTLNRFQCGA